MAILAFIIAILCLAAAAGLIWMLLRARAQRADLLRLDTLLAPQTTDARIVQPALLVEALPAILRQTLHRAGLEPSSRQIVQATAAMAVSVLAVAAAGGIAAGLTAGVAITLLGWTAVEYTARRRMRQLSDCMIGFFERVRQLLAVGNSLSVALQRATDSSPPVVMKYLTSTVRRISNGTGVGESLGRCAAELDVYELHLLAAATHTNIRFGGSMGNVLRNIIETIRRRSTIERELRASTMEIRASAWVLALLPVLVAGVVMSTNRDYSQWFLATQAGHHMLVYAAVSQAIGIWCMRTIIRTRY